MPLDKQLEGIYSKLAYEERQRRLEEEIDKRAAIFSKLHPELKTVQDDIDYCRKLLRK